MMNQPDIAESLPPFLSPACRSRVSISSLQKGDYLFRDGDPVRDLFYVVDGALKAVRYNLDGKEMVMLRGVSGEFFAESGIALTHYVCAAIAEKDTLVAGIPVEVVMDELGGAESFALGLILQVSRNARKQCSRYERLRLKRAQDRIIHYLVCETGSQGVFEVTTSLADLADELGLEPETLYRSLSELEKAGRIQKQSRSIRLLW